MTGKLGFLIPPIFGDLNLGFHFNGISLKSKIITT
jgi:hypothetical protein